MPSRSAMFDEDLGRAAEDGRVAVDRGVARQHPDVVGAEVAAEREELLADERLDGRRVEAALALAQRKKVHRERHERLAAARRRREDHVLPRQELEDGLLLRGVELEAELAHVTQEEIEELVRRGPGPGGTRSPST